MGEASTSCGAPGPPGSAAPLPSPAWKCSARCVVTFPQSQTSARFSSFKPGSTAGLRGPAPPFRFQPPVGAARPPPPPRAPPAGAAAPRPRLRRGSRGRRIPALRPPLRPPPGTAGAAAAALRWEAGAAFGTALERLCFGNQHLRFPAARRAAGAGEKPHFRLVCSFGRPRHVLAELREAAVHFRRMSRAVAIAVGL